VPFNFRLSTPARAGKLRSVSPSSAIDDPFAGYPDDLFAGYLEGCTCNLE
jgi:hypothetical protein